MNTIRQYLDIQLEDAKRQLNDEPDECYRHYLIGLREGFYRIIHFLDVQDMKNPHIIPLSEEKGGEKC